MKNIKNWIILTVLAFIIGTGLLIMGENQINSQKAQLATLQQTIQKNNDQINTLVKSNASESAQVKSLLTQPTPTPVIEYHTQYVSQPTPKSNSSSASNSTGGIQGVSAAQLSCWYITGDARGCPQQ